MSPDECLFSFCISFLCFTLSEKRCKVTAFILLGKVLFIVFNAYMKYYSPERACLGMRGMKAASFGGTGGVRAAHENVCNTCRDMVF